MNKLDIKGIIPPMITPLLSNDVLDVEGTERLVEHILAGGVHGLFLLGTTGEAQSLSYELKYELVKRVCDQVAGRVPVLVGITDTSFDESVRLAQHSEKCGAAAVVAAAPYYFPPSQKELVDYYKALADALPLPLYLYNMPSKVKVFLNADTVKELSAHPNIAGLKDSSGNICYFVNLLYQFEDKDFSLFIGPEEAMSVCVLMGADGGVSGGANLFPELFVKMYNAAVAKDMPLVHKLQNRIMYLSNTLYNLFPSDASFVKAIKTSLEIKGICSGYLPFPFRKADEKEKELVKQTLLKLEDYR